MAIDSDNVFAIDASTEDMKIAKLTRHKLTQEENRPCRKVGRHWCFRRETIDRWLEEFWHNEPEQRGNR